MYYMALADLVRAKMSEKNFSTYDIARAAEAAGHKINANTITRILNGNINEPTHTTLRAIAAAFDMPFDDFLRKAEHGLDAMPTAFDIYAGRFDADDLTEAEWTLLESVFRNQVDQYRQTKKRLSPPAKKGK